MAVGPSDWEPWSASHGSMAGVALQLEAERCAMPDRCQQQLMTLPMSTWSLESMLVYLRMRLRREAARRGGGRFVAPVQRVSDFMESRTSSGELPSSSYRLGVRSAPLHDLYSAAIADALHAALLRFDRQMPGFISHDGLLHGVETRTSSPCSIGDTSPNNCRF